jgi:hypothetical protein
MERTVAELLSISPNFTNLRQLTIAAFISPGPGGLLAQSLDVLWPVISQNIRILHLEPSAHAALDLFAYLARAFAENSLTRLETLTLAIAVRDRSPDALTNIFSQAFTALIQPHTSTLRSLSLVIPGNVIPIHLGLLFRALSTQYNPQLQLRSLTLHVPFDRRHIPNTEALNVFLNSQKDTLYSLDLAENTIAHDQGMGAWLSDSFSQLSLPGLRSLTLKLRRHYPDINYGHDIEALAIHAPNLTSLDMTQISMPWDSFLALCELFGNLSTGGLEDLHIAVYLFSADMLKCLAMHFSNLRSLELRYYDLTIGERFDSNTSLVSPSTSVSDFIAVSRLLLFLLFGLWEMT